MCVCARVQACAHMQACAYTKLARVCVCLCVRACMHASVCVAQIGSKGSMKGVGGGMIRGFIEPELGSP